MKRIILLALLCSCVRDPYAPPLGYVRDDLFCWYFDSDNRWTVRGLSHTCPDNTPYGTVYQMPKR